MQKYQQLLTEWFEQSSSASSDLATTTFVLAALFLLRFFIRRVLHHRISDPAMLYRSRRLLGYLVGAIAVLVLVWIWFPGMEEFGTFLGLVSAGLAVAMHDTVANLTGWLFIVFRRPFQVGDRIEIDGTAGDVIDIRLFQFSLLEIGNWVDADQSTGRIVHMPNGLALRNKVANYTSGFAYIWCDLGVLITFESNWQKAKTILSEIAHDAAGAYAADAQRQIASTAQYLISYGKLTPIVYTTVRDSGVLLSIRYLTHPRQRRASEQRIWEHILIAFAQHPDIELAYPTIRRFDAHLEAAAHLQAHQSAGHDSGGSGSGSGSGSGRESARTIE